MWHNKNMRMLLLELLCVVRFKNSTGGHDMTCGLFYKPYVSRYV